MASPEGSPDASSALAELSGTVIEERYALGGVLGAGGMGAVFEGRDLRLDRPVAIKVMRPVFVGHDEYIRRFLREAQSASKIRHRNVVVILDYGEAKGGLVYSVMEFLVGEDLEHILRKSPQQRMPWARVCGLLFQIADDVLDLRLEPGVLGPAGTGHGGSGKDPGQDLREGKMTLPIILACQADPALGAEIQALLGAGPPMDEATLARLLPRITRTEATEQALNVALRHVEQAVQALQALPPSAARDALVGAAHYVVHRTL
ncbi:MAG: protein kinase [Myxococcales bacterium]|nr:protein kinase [Myxococcales bacterium]